MGNVRQTLERRQLGLQLRRLRERHGRTQQEAAAAIGKVRSRIVDLEDGRSTVRPTDLTALLDLYAATDTQRAELSALAIQAAKRHRRLASSNTLPEAMTHFAELELSATEISTFEPNLVPGLLQSQGYVQALVSECDGIWWPASTTEQNERVAFRMERQQRILGDGGPASLRFVLGEEALRAVVGGPDVMRDQRRHLLALADQHPAIQLQVLPSAVPGNPARTAGFTLFHFGPHSTPLAFSSPVFGPDRLHDEDDDVAKLALCFTRVCRLALGPEDSRTLIARALKGSG